MKTITPDKIDENGIAHFIDKSSPFVEGKPVVQRNVVHVIVINRRTNEVLGLHWPKENWHALVVGGIEDGQDHFQAAEAEVREETGYTNIRFLAELAKTSTLFYAGHKQVNRQADAIGLLYELVDDTRVEVSAEELLQQTPVWIPLAEMSEWLNLDNQSYNWNKALEFLQIESA